MTPDDLSFEWFAWEALDAPTLYAFLKLRSDIFVVEQDCVFSDMDGLDAQAQHLVMRNLQGLVCGYARLLPPGVKYPDASIGRVVVDASIRRHGAGALLMQKAILGAKARHPNFGVLVWAQQQLESFYQQIGFITISDPEPEDGIMHVLMRLSV